MFALVRTTGLVVSEASVIAERANLFAEVIVYAQRFVASNNATHSCDKSHNRWLCPLRSISANASACFSLRLRSARVPGFTLQSNGTAFAVRNPRFGIKKEQLTLFLFWWRCGELTRRCFLANYYIIKYYIMFPIGRKIWHKYGTNC